jgi:hypothetical protein
MPVFVIVSRHSDVHAAHPDHKGVLPKGDAEDLMQRGQAPGAMRMEAISSS